MASTDLRLQTLRKAITACRETPGRAGRVVHLQDAEDVLVGGDLHGDLGNFRALMTKADLAHHPRRHLVLQELIHGPFQYPDGSDKSHQLVELVCALKCQFPRQVHYLIGNHELAQASGRPIGKLDSDLNEQFVKGVRAAYALRADEVYAAYLELFAIAPLVVRTAGRVYISHSVPSAGMLPDFDPAALEQLPSRASDLAPGGSIYALVWGRDVRPETVAAFLDKVDAGVLITGHLPCDAGFARPSPRHVIVDGQGSPAAYCLIPAGRPVEPGELDGMVHLL